MKSVSAKAFLLSLFVALAGCAGNPFDDREFIYTAVGASDAVGIGAIPLRNGYVYQIREELADREKGPILINLGRPGANTEAINEAVHLFLRTRISPDLVTVWAGSNDIVGGVEPDKFEHELRELLAWLRAGTDAFIVIANIPDISRLPRFEEEPDENVTLDRINSFNGIIKQLAQEFNVPVVDLFAQQIDEEFISEIDGFHPSNEGHRHLAKLFLEVIVPTL